MSYPLPSVSIRGSLFFWKMKAILILVLFCSTCYANEDPPKQVRVSVQYIEVSHPVLTELLSGAETGGHALHAKAMELAKKSEAKILETAMVVCRSGHKSYELSILEEIYPTEYESPSARMMVPSPDYRDVEPVNPMFRSVLAWETKDTGIILDAGLTVDAETQIIDLRCIPEFIRRLRIQNLMEHKDQWGEASYKMPIYEKWSANTSLSLRSGKSELVSVINPKDQPAPPAVSRRILLFVRADILEPPTPE